MPAVQPGSVIARFDFFREVTDHGHPAVCAQWIPGFLAGTRWGKRFGVLRERPVKSPFAKHQPRRILWFLMKTVTALSGLEVSEV